MAVTDEAIEKIKSMIVSGALRPGARLPKESELAAELGLSRNSLREAVQEVQDGELDIEVPVYDASEIGQLQAGFNSMVAGLRERERIQDLFGRHVGEDVARAALDQGIELGGELVS